MLVQGVRPACARCLKGITALIAAALAPSAWAEGPIDAALLYTSEIWTAASGGASSDLRYLDNLDLIIDADLEAGLGWRGTSMRIYGLYNNGKSFTQLAGDAQVVSSIETGVQAFLLYEAWVEQRFGRASFKAGLMEVNFEFDVLESANLFVHAAHGFGTDIGLSGRTGPSTFPLTSLGARADYQISETIKARVAVFDGVPGDPNAPNRTAIKLGNGDGALIIGEAEIAIPKGKILAGHWRFTRDFSAFDGPPGTGDRGTYVRAERQVFQAGTDPQAGLTAFARLGIANGGSSSYSRFVGAGLVYQGVGARRPRDQIGIAVAAAFASNRFQQQTGARAAEWNVELTYRLEINEHLALQPDIQYIINPAANAGLRDVVAIGLRAQIGAAF